MNPAEHEARMEAERRGRLPGSDEDRQEAALLAERDDDGDFDFGAWVLGEVPT